MRRPRISLERFVTAATTALLAAGLLTACGSGNGFLVGTGTNSGTRTTPTRPTQSVAAPTTPPPTVTAPTIDADCHGIRNDHRGRGNAAAGHDDDNDDNNGRTESRRRRGRSSAAVGRIEQHAVGLNRFAILAAAVVVGGIVW